MSPLRPSRLLESLTLARTLTSGLSASPIEREHFASGAMPGRRGHRLLMLASDVAPKATFRLRWRIVRPAYVTALVLPRPYGAHPLWLHHTLEIVTLGYEEPDGSMISMFVGEAVTAEFFSEEHGHDMATPFVLEVGRVFALEIRNRTDEVQPVKLEIQGRWLAEQGEPTRILAPHPAPAPLPSAQAPRALSATKGRRR